MSETSGRSAREQPTGRMPVLFVGHGSPMNAIEDNVWSRGFRGLAKQLPRPKAILSVSAHWFDAGTYVTGSEFPPTIHDFSGFPSALYEVEYPAPGDVALARRVAALIGTTRASLRTDWGIDHGTWSVLIHMVPLAVCPVVQLSIDARMPPLEHVALGRSLAPLCAEGVLVMGSGNITHNLQHALASHRSGDVSTPPWAEAFDRDVARAAEQHDADYLARVVDTDDGRMCHPTLDHYLPLMYVVGAAAGTTRVQFPMTGFDLGSLSMRAIVFG